MRSPKEECESLMDELIPFAIQMIEEQGSFLPFGAQITSDRTIELVGGYDGEDAAPEELIGLLHESFRQSAINGEIEATGIAIDMRIRSGSGEGEPRDAIGIELDHRMGYSVMVFAPYTKSTSGVELGDFSAQMGKNGIFAKE